METIKYETLDGVFYKGELQAFSLATADDRYVLQDKIAPSTPMWALTVPNAKNTAYSDLEMSFSEPIASIDGITSSTGGTISNIRIVEGIVIFDWITPNAGGSILTFVNVKDVAGNASSPTKINSLPN